MQCQLTWLLTLGVSQRPLTNADLG